MVDAESTDLVCIDQYLTKCRNCLRPNCWENCLGRFDFSVSTFQRIWIFHSPIKSKNPRVVFQALFRSGSELLHIYLIEKLFLSFEVGFFFFAICYCLGLRTWGSKIWLAIKFFISINTLFSAVWIPKLIRYSATVCGSFSCSLQKFTKFLLFNFHNQ